MKRNNYLRFCGYLPCVAAALFMLFSGFESNAQSIEFCGEYHKPNNVQPTDSIYYTDRFGNFYTRQELTISPSQLTASTGQISVNHCAAGQKNYFRIIYDSGSVFTPQERETIECAFSDISARIIPLTDRHLPNILIRKRDIQHGLLASASGMYEQSEYFCDLEYSSVWKKLYTESKRDDWNRIDAIIDIDPLLDWQLHDDPADPKKIDLFFIIQHQALHAMGIETYICKCNVEMGSIAI
jgi:hypothetical protein